MNRNLFGHVGFIKKDNPMLEITVNRERLIENEAFEELEKFVRLGIDFATVLYSGEINKELKEKKEREEAISEAIKKKEEAEKRKIEAEQLLSEQKAKKAEEEKKRAEIKAKLAERKRRKAEEKRRKAEEKRRKAEEEALKTEEREAIINAEAARKSEEESLKEEIEAIREEEEEIKNEAEARREAESEGELAETEKEKAELEKKQIELIRKKHEEEDLKKQKQEYYELYSQLRVLASTGTVVLIFQHEMQALIEDMEEMNKSFSLILIKLSESEQRTYTSTLISFSNRIEMIKELGIIFGLVVGRESRLEKKEWVLFPIVESVFNLFKWYFSENGIDYFNTIPDNLRTPKMLRSELVSVLHNLMSNAVKAVKLPEKKEEEEVVAAEDEGSLFPLVTLNTGLKVVVCRPAQYRRLNKKVALVLDEDERERAMDLIEWSSREIYDRRNPSSHRPNQCRHLPGGSAPLPTGLLEKSRSGRH